MRIKRFIAIPSFALAIFLIAAFSINRTNSTLDKIKVEEGVWLSLLPRFGLDEFNDEVVDLLKVYLVNRSDKGLHFVYEQSFLSNINFELK